MKFIQTNKAPTPNGHYSQAVVNGGIIYTSIQLGIDPNNDTNTIKNVKEQAYQVLSNLQAILEEAGSNKENIIRIMIYVTDIKYWEDINSVYTEFMGNHKPARGVVPVSELHLGYNIAMEAIASIDSK